MIYYLSCSAWGYAVCVADYDNEKKLYIQTVHKDGSYDFTADYSLAKRWKNCDTARKHLENLKNSDN